MSQSFASHISPPTRTVLPRTVRNLPLYVFYSALPKGQFCAFSSSSTILPMYPFLFTGRSRSPTQNRSFSFSGFLIEVMQIRFHPYLLPQETNISSDALPHPPFLSACFPLGFVFSLTIALYPPTLTGLPDLVLVSSYSLPYFQDYTIPSHYSVPFRYFLPYGPINDGWRSFS